MITALSLVCMLFATQAAHIMFDNINLNKGKWASRDYSIEH